MRNTSAKLTAFSSTYKKRDKNKQSYLVKRLRELYNDAISNFETAFDEKPNTLFTTPYILKCLASNDQQLINIDDLDGIKKQYFHGIRIIPTQINIIIAGLCSDEDTIIANLCEVNSFEYNIIKHIDDEYDQQLEMAP